MITKEELESIDGFFQAANYLSVAQIYLKSNPLLRKKLKKDDVKERLVGHFGSAPNQNFIYTHLNRVITKYNLNMFYISGPGHAGQALVACNYLEGTYSKFYPTIKENIDGLTKLCKRFSYPFGVSSHAAPETPGSINEGGELGYSLVHAYGAVLDNPNLIVACCVGDGEAETGTIATSWHLNKFINRETDGVVLPIINLNGYKIANPTILGRMSDIELTNMFSGMGYEVLIVSGKDRMTMHKKMIKTLDYAIEKIQDLKSSNKPYILPLIILRTPKGWTGPKKVNGNIIEGSFRSHQVPFNVETDKELEMLSNWLMSYEPNKLFDNSGKLKNKYKKYVPSESKRMGNSLYANGGILRKELKFPNVYNYAVKGETMDTFELGKYLRDLIVKNPNNFRIFGPDEALSNRLNKVFEVTNRQWNMDIDINDEYLNSRGRIIDSFLSENICEGLLEGYVLTGRHGLFHTYEAFSRIVDSMISQHLKWIYSASHIKWRKEISSINILLTSHIWQQDHNGYTHQEPGILNHLITKKKDYIGMYLPMDANTLICCMDKCLKEKNKVNVIVASKHKRETYLNMNDAKVMVNKGLGILKFASDSNPDIVLICSGDTPTLEVLASVKILKEFIPKLRIRVVNVINPLVLDKSYKQCLDNQEFKKIFKDVPSLFVFHGYPSVIYEVLRERKYNTKVIGYKEEGAITTPFDMRVKNEIDRFHICLEILKISKFKSKKLEEYCVNMLNKHRRYIKKYGKDLNEINNY